MGQATCGATGRYCRATSGTRGAAGGRRTVLAVEDDDAVRELIRLALEETGARILLAGSGAKAAALAAGMPIDLLIADVVLPDQSGIDLARTLRAERPALCVIYVTGLNDLAAFAKVEDDPRVLKPFTLDEMRRAVARALDEDAW